jgi:hypothetical protein
MKRRHKLLGENWYIIYQRGSGMVRWYRIMRKARTGVFDGDWYGLGDVTYHPDRKYRWSFPSGEEQTPCTSIRQVLEVSWAEFCRRKKVSHA